MLGDSTFWHCEQLRRVTFAPGSKLKVIGPECFMGAGIEEMVIPKSVEKMQRSAFEGCGSLEEVVFEEGSKLETI